MSWSSDWCKVDVLCLACLLGIFPGGAVAVTQTVDGGRLGPLVSVGIVVAARGAISRHPADCWVGRLIRWSLRLMAVLLLVLLGARIVTLIDNHVSTLLHLPAVEHSFANWSLAVFLLFEGLVAALATLVPSMLRSPSEQMGGGDS